MHDYLDWCRRQKSFAGLAGTTNGTVTVSGDDRIAIQSKIGGNMAEILDQKGEPLARSRGLFIAIDPKKMFAKFVEK